jgi:hypothetical protein
MSQPSLTDRAEGTTTARCPACGRSVKWLASGYLVAHNIQGERCPGSGGDPAQDPPLAAWLPVKQGLTPHELPPVARPRDLC